MSKISLFSEKSHCCGCGVCSQICPKQAIVMKKDEYGFYYPDIDDSLCIGCNKCVKSCAFQNISVINKPLNTYVAVLKDKSRLLSSASGGAFYAFSEYVLDSGGIVYGASFDDYETVKHIYIDSKMNLYKLQGSKYVQSDTHNIFIQLKEFLESGRKVIFSGTPCQVASVYGYLGRDYDNLFTVDLVCHGVPSNQMYVDYIHTLKNDEADKIEKFTFRDKKLGWGKNGKVIVKNGDKSKVKKLWQSESSYLYYFSQGYIYRESCYNCKYACSRRPGDISIGDYWGIEREHPEFLKQNKIDESKGISLIITNSEKGNVIVKESKRFLELYHSTFEKASRENEQLKYPSKYNSKRDIILKLYRESGWNAVEEYFRRNIGLKRYSSFVKSLIPKKFKRILKSNKK